jgi:tetratricopeptide (TPR) repeat protein
MTDHLIQRQPGGAELVAPLQESIPTIVDVDFLYPDQVEKTLETEVLRTIAVLRASGSRHTAAANHLERGLAKLEPDSITPYLDLARAQLKQHHFAAAERTLETLLQRHPDNPLALEWLGTALSLTKPQAAIRWMRQALSFDPDRPEIRFNLGLLLLGQEQPREALLHLRMATRLRSNMAPAFLHLGNTYRMLGSEDSALSAYNRALDIDPGLSQAYLALGQFHLEQGKPSLAWLIWQRGLDHARLPAPIARAMQKQQAKGTSDLQ